MSLLSYDEPLSSGVRRRHKSIALAIVLLMTISAFFTLQLAPTVAAASSNPNGVRDQSVQLTQSLVLRAGYYNYYEIDSFSNNTTVAYAMESSTPISTALMTSAQLNDFANNASDPISNSIAYVNGTSAENNVTISPGQYFLVFYDYSSRSRAEIEFGYQTSPNTPFSYGSLTTPLASGIATFGIANNSGTVTPYQVNTNEIVGIANISSMQVDTPDAYQYGDSVTGATLQMNTVLVVNDNGGSEQKVYWVQNVPDFETGPSQVAFGDEIWNWTDEAGFLSNQTVTSTNLQNGGAVYPTGEGNSGPYVYNYNDVNETYNLPLNFALVTSETVLPNTGVLVQLGYLLTANGSAITQKINWFDNVTIVDPTVQSAYFEVSGGATPPIGLFYDAELVFAGEGNLEVAHFTQFSASLGLFYQSSTNPSGTLSSFPTYYSFNGDTGEAVDDLVVTYSNGIASIGTGVNPNYVYLGNASRSLNLQSMTTSTTSTSSTSQTTTSTTASYSTTITTTTSQTTSATSSKVTTTQTTTVTSPVTTTATMTSTTTSPTTTTQTMTVTSPVTTTVSSTTTQTSTISSTLGSMPAWEWAAIGVVLGVVIASLGFMAIRRKPTSPYPV